MNIRSFLQWPSIANAYYSEQNIVSAVKEVALKEERKMFGQFPVVSQLEKCRSTVRASHTGSERIVSLGVKVFYKVKTEAKFYA